MASYSQTVPSSWLVGLKLVWCFVPIANYVCQQAYPVLEAERGEESAALMEPIVL